LEWTWDNRGKIRKAVDTVRRWFLGKSRILILGAGGTGKSTFAKTISGGFDWLHDSPWDYDQSLVSERLTLQHHRTVEVLILPGQKQRRAREWPKVASAIAAGKYAGVIYFSTFGYHTPAEASLKMLTGEKTKEAALERYLARTRQDELDVFKTVADPVRLSPKRLWLLSVVAKQDLWADEDDAVQAHYRAGEYGAVVDRLTAEKAAGTFAHEFAFCSLVIANMVEHTGAVVKKTAAGYDYQRQIRSVRHLVELLDGLRAWEVEK